MDKFKKGDLITNNSGSFAKVLRVGATVLATKWYESPKDAMGSTDGSVCFNDRAVKVLGIRAVSKKSKNTDENDEEVTTTTAKPKKGEVVKEVIDLDEKDTIEHIVTEQDLEMNPEWAEAGIVVGDSIFYKENPTDEELAEAIELAVKEKALS